MVDVEHNFNPYRLGSVHTWLTDLVSTLPEHAGHAVATSLTSWRDEMYRTDPQLAAGLISQAYRSQAPGSRQPWYRWRRHAKVAPHTTVVRTSEQRVAALQPYSARLSRQGELWLSVLTGEKNPKDLLGPRDYVSAAARSLRDGARLLWRSPAIVLVPFGVMAAALAAVLFLLATAHGTNPEARIFVQVVAVAGAVGAWLKSVAGRVKVVARVLEQPLYAAALDAVIADAITLPPVGPADPSGWVQYIEAAALAIAQTHFPGYR